MVRGPRVLGHPDRAVAQQERTWTIGDSRTRDRIGAHVRQGHRKEGVTRTGSPTWVRPFVRTAGALTILAIATVALGGAGAGATGSHLQAHRTPALSSRDTTTTNDFTLTVDPTQNLSEGEAMNFTVTATASATAAGLQIYAAATGWCQYGTGLPLTAEYVAYQSVLGLGQFPSMSFTGGTDPACVGNVNNDAIITGEAISPPLSSSGQYPTLSSTAYAETGIAGGVTCDSDDPCEFAVAVWTFNSNDPGAEKVIYPIEVPVTFAPSTLAAACGGAAPGQVESAGPDRLDAIVTAWTLSACSSGIGGGKELTDNTSSQVSDAIALSDFASGDADLAYSGVGYNATDAPGYNAQPGFAPSTARPYVAIPIALNAVVFAHTESDVVPSEVPPVVGPYPYPLDITIDQAAELLSNGGFVTGDGAWNGALGQGILGDGQNSELENDEHYGYRNVISGQLVATSGTDATTLFATAFLNALAPASVLMSYPDDQASIPSEQLGVASNFGTNDPPYYTQTETGLDLIEKALTPISGQEWALTDSASAANLWGGLADMSIQNPASLGSGTPTFVAPDQASMDAAVSDMSPQPDGTLLPNPANDSDVNGVAPYPLTYVEYAIAPAQPLLNADCTPDTQEQQALTAWLDYITGYGQTLITPSTGMAPLTPALDQVAQADIAKVGASAPACTPAGTTTTTTTPGSTAASGTSTPSSASSSASSSAAATATTDSFSTPLSLGAETLPADVVNAPLGASPSAKSGTRVTHAASKGNATRPDPAAELAGFRGAVGEGWGPPVFGVLLLAVLVPGLVLMLSGRSVGQVVTGLRGRMLARRNGPGGAP